MWRFLSAALASVLLIAGAPQAFAETQLVYSWPTNVGPLNPHLYSPNQIFAQAMVYEPLVRYQADGTIAPWLATSWTVSDDGRIYEFTLRDGVSFTDGTPFDAAAVKANFDAILANLPRHAWLELARQIESTEAPSARTFRLTLKRAYYPTLQELALPRPFRFISPKAMIDGTTVNGIHAPIGTGPWRLVTTKLGESDLFEANASYWGNKPGFDKLLIKVIPDPNTRAVALQTGDIDLIYGTEGQISADTFERFRSMKGAFATAVSQPLATRAIAINSKLAPTSDRAVRIAINHAVDKDAIINSVMSETEPRADFLFAPNVPYANVGLKPYSYDPALAGKLLDDAGWVRGADGVRAKDGIRLSVEINFVGNNAQQKAISEVLQADFAKVGIASVLVGEEESSIQGRQRDGRFGLIFGSTWGAPYDPHSFMSSMRAPSHADYQAQLGLPMKADIDRKIGEVLVSINEDRRKELYRDLLTTLHDEAVYLPISYATVIAVNRPTITGVRFGASVNEIPLDAIRPAKP